MLISSCTYRYHHSDSEAKVRLNPVDSIKVLTINLDAEKVVSVLFAIGCVKRKTFFKNCKSDLMRWPYTSNFPDEVTPECLLLAANCSKAFFGHLGWWQIPPHGF